MSAGTDPLESSASALALVVVARRDQPAFRIGSAAAGAVVCQALTGWRIALVWVAAYTAMQVAEHRTFRGVANADDLGPGRTRAVLTVISAGTVVFGAFGLLQAQHAGPWGLVCAASMWTGAILNGAMVNSGSRAALLASIIPSALYFLSAPYFVIAAGEPIRSRPQARVVDSRLASRDE